MNQDERPALSIVAPVFNGEPFIAESIHAIVAALDRTGQSFELIVVSDGSTDGTLAAAQAVVEPRVRIVGYPLNEGKGSAVARGLSEARGRYVGWIDADLDVDPDVLVEAARVVASEHVDAVVGSKRHPRSEVVYPRIRRLYSWGFQVLVRVLFRVNVRDTQVGAKLFRREMLDTIGSLLLIKRYAFDLEVLAVGAEFGFDRVAEVPVRLNYRFTGTNINLGAVRGMFVDTLAIAYRLHIRHWYVRRFAALHRHRIDDIGSGALVAFADDPRDVPPPQAEPTPPVEDAMRTA